MKTNVIKSHGRWHFLTFPHCLKSGKMSPEKTNCLHGQLDRRAWLLDSSHLIIMKIMIFDILILVIIALGDYLAFGHLDFSDYDQIIWWRYRSKVLLCETRQTLEGCVHNCCHLRFQLHNFNSHSYSTSGCVFSNHTISPRQAPPDSLGG